jgi:hypothetical protein
MSRVIELRKSKALGALFAGLIGSMLIFALANLFSIRDTARPSKISVFYYDLEGKKLDIPLQLMQLDPGRYRIGANDLQNKELRVQLVSDRKNFPEFLMIRKGSDPLKKSSMASIQVSVLNGPQIEVAGADDSYSKRTFIPLPQTQSQVELTIRPTLGQNPTLPLVIDEIGLYRRIPKVFLGKSQFKLLILSVFAIAATSAMLILRNLNEKLRASLGAIFCFVFAALVHTSMLAVSSDPEYNRDLRVIFASGTLQEPPGTNLNYGLHMASSILQGKGPLIADSPSWCRMPGYGYLLALSGSAFDLLQMAMRALLIQSLFFALSLAFFFWASIKIIPLQASLCTSMIACLINYLPPSLYYLQIETVMPAIVLLVLGTSCLFYNQLRLFGKASFVDHALLHLSFALWFFLRTDILPAWFAMSLFLYVRKASNWKYFFIPFILVSFIAISWGLFKMAYTQEFSMTTNSIGASMMVGLWEIPHDFIWEVADGSYYQWMNDLGFNPCSKAASNFAVQEVIRFLITFPFFAIGLWFHKFFLFISGADSNLFSSHWLRLYLLVVILLSFILKYKEKQTLMLSFLIFFNVPIFFQFFSSCGRFYQAPSICLFAAASSLLFDPEFRQKLIQNKGRVCAVIAFAFIFIQIAPRFDAFLVQNKSLKTYAPFLDPSHSTLNILKKEKEAFADESNPY